MNVELFVWETSTRHLVGAAILSGGSPVASVPGSTLAVTLADLIKQFGRPVLVAESLDRDQPSLQWLDTSLRYDYKGPLLGVTWYPPPTPGIMGVK